MQKLLASSALALLLTAGSLAIATPSQAQGASVAATCSSQTLAVGYLTGTLIQLQNGDLCTNFAGTFSGVAGFTAEATATAVTPGTNKPASEDSASGAQRVVIMLPGSVTPATFNPNGQNTAANSQSMVLASDQPAVPTNPRGCASCGMSTASRIAANNTTSVVVSAAASTVYEVRTGGISTATPAWVKLYDAAQGSTTCGSGTPKLRFLIPANVNGAGGVYVVGGGQGVAFATAVTSCIVTGIADNDATAPAAATYVAEVDYKD